MKNEPQKPWVLVHKTLFGDIKKTEFDSHSKAKNALHWVLKDIKDNFLDEEAWIEPKDIKD